MDISFTGIENIKILQKTSKKFGSYLSYNNEIKQGNKIQSEIHIHCDLTNDANGNDVNDFYDAIKRSGGDYALYCINPKSPKHIELCTKGFRVQDDIVKTSNAQFKINGKDIMLTNDKVLALYTFMAKLTRKITQKPEMSERQKYFAQLVNDFVDAEAREYLDMPPIKK